MKYHGKPRPKTPAEFIAMWKEQAEGHFGEVRSPESEVYYGDFVSVDNFSAEQIAQIENLLRMVIHSSYVNVLAGLDGVAVAGGVYQIYTVVDEEGRQLVPSEDFTSAWHEWAYLNC